MISRSKPSDDLEHDASPGTERCPEKNPRDESWKARLRADPTPWLLEDETPAVRHLALRFLLNRADDDPDVLAARAAAMRVDPIFSILANQDGDGFWVKPGPGYAPKYRGTVWQLIFLDQLGADPDHPQIHAACRYVLAHSHATNGGFGMSGRVSGPPAPSSVVHCLNGNLLRALIGFEWLDDERVQQAISWQVRAIRGGDGVLYDPAGTSGPGFRCAINEDLPCAWGAIKAVRGLARIPPERRTPDVQRAIAQGRQFLLSRDPLAADYPAGWGNQAPSPLWFKLGFPSGYVADVLQNLESLCELGAANDQRTRRAIGWLLDQQDDHGRWRNQSAYRGRMWADVDKPLEASKWVTLRACTVIKSSMT